MDGVIWKWCGVVSLAGLLSVSVCVCLCVSNGH